MVCTVETVRARRCEYTGYDARCYHYVESPHSVASLL